MSSHLYVQKSPCLHELYIISALQQISFDIFLYCLVTEREVKMAWYWLSSFFGHLWLRLRSINTQKTNNDNIQPSRPINSCVNGNINLWRLVNFSKLSKEKTELLEISTKDLPGSLLNGNLSCWWNYSLPAESKKYRRYIRYSHFVLTNVLPISANHCFPLFEISATSGSTSHWPPLNYSFVCLYLQGWITTMPYSLAY